MIPANSNYAGPTQQADTGYGSPTSEAPDAYGAPQADPVSSYHPPTPAPNYGAGSKEPVFVSDVMWWWFKLICLLRNTLLIVWDEMPSPRGGGPHVLTGVGYSTQFSMEESPVPGHSLGWVRCRFCPYLSIINSFLDRSICPFQFDILHGSSRLGQCKEWGTIQPDKIASSTINGRYKYFDHILLKAHNYF